MELLFFLVLQLSSMYYTVFSHSTMEASILTRLQIVWHMGRDLGLLLSQTRQKRKMSYMGNELYLHLKTGNLQVGSRAPDMSMCFQHLRLTLTNLQRRKRNLKNPNLQMSMNRAHLTSSSFNIQVYLSISFIVFVM
ncbi:hypothetical protein Hdeb2414_s0007g00259171 [Helianthus debilis subsp. tardiflorus]